MFAITQKLEDQITGEIVPHYWYGGHLWGQFIEQAGRFYDAGHALATVDLIKSTGVPMPTAQIEQLPDDLPAETTLRD
jgi:hypothetical protein